MTNYHLRTPVVDPAILMEAASTLAESPRLLSISDIEEVIDRSENYAKAVVLLGQQLELIVEQDDGYEVVRDVRMQVRQASTDQRSALLAVLLQNYRPFIAFTAALVQDIPPQRAALQAKVLFEIDLDEEQLKEQFVKLGVYANILEEMDGEIGIEMTTTVITDEHTREFATSVGDPLIARLFLENRLDDELVAYMDEEVLAELITALELFWDRPRSAIAAAGRAVEDFQRMIGDDQGSQSKNYSSANGITELSDMLHSDGLTKSRHLHGGKYLGSMRNPSGGHGKDPETLKRWDVPEEVALGYVLSAIHYIRSLFAYVVQDRQVL